MGVALNDRSQDGMGTPLDPDRQAADLHGIQLIAFLYGERIVHEVLYGGQHARHHIGVLHGGVARDHMLEEQSGFLMDQEHLLHPVQQRMTEDHLAERTSGP